MIEKLHLKNFQIYEDTELELSPGINAIIGSNDQGKSTIFCFLWWVFIGKPLGDEIIRTGKKETIGSCTINGNTIQKIREKNKNKYIINNQTFSALNKSIPEQLSDIIKITPTNIQYQDAPPFLLSESPSEVAKRLNTVVGLNQIDSSYKYINSFILRQESKRKVLEQQIKEDKIELKKFKKLGIIEKKLEYFKTLELEVEGNRNQIQLLLHLIKEIKKLGKVIKLQDKISKTFSKLNYLEDIKGKLINFQNKTVRIKNFIGSILILDKKIQHEGFIFKKIKRKATEIAEKTNSLKLIQNDTQKLNHLILSISQSKKSVNTQKTNYEKTKEEFQKFKQNLKICPLCNRKF